MLLTPVLLLAFDLALQPHSGLRLVNGSEFPVEASIACGANARMITIAARGLADVAAVELAPCSGSGIPITVRSSAPLLTIETLDADSDSQRVIESSECSIAMDAPLFVCRRGTATASVPQLPGATYTWTVEGAALVSGADTNRATIALAEATQAKLSCLIVSPSCTTTATGVIAVRDPLVIRALTAPQSVDGNQPVTIEWSYDGSPQPLSQMLTGNALSSPVALPSDQRRYTFIPASSGEKWIELQASYGSLATTTRTSSRRRSVGFGVSATQCPDAHASAKFEVRGCVVRTPIILAPNEVDPGATFTASVLLENGETAHWSVTNGIPDRTDGASIEIRAEQQGDVAIAVRVERTPSCFAESLKQVAIAQPVQCPSTPTARVDLASTECDKATIRATFTGVPPFSGVWTDNVPFMTLDKVLTREVTQHGSYSLRSLRDGVCESTKVEGWADWTPYYATVELTTEGGTCTSSKIVAKFTGTPPFAGTLTHSTQSTPFTTNDSTLVFDSLITGMYQITNFRGGRCPTYIAQHSNTISISESRVTVGPTQYCQTQPESYPNERPFSSVSIYWGKPPLTAEWDDGVVMQSNTGRLTRTFPYPSEARKTHRVVRASTGDCAAAILQSDSTEVILAPRPLIDNATLDTVVCPGVLGHASLINSSFPGGTLTWSITDDVTIVSGQGAPSITFRSNKAGSASLLVSATYAECPTANDSRYIWFPGNASANSLRVDSTIIKQKGFTTVRFSKDGGVASFELHASPGHDQDLTLPVDCPDGHNCYVQFRDSVGTVAPANDPVTVQFTLSYRGYCSNDTKYLYTTLTIVP